MSVQLVVRIPEEQKLMLEVIADNRKSSVAQITRLAIKDYVAKTSRDKSNLFIRLANIGKKGKKITAPKDLSSNYKRYLYGK